jgi:glycosyltransferase involved in cell wall biosynthesis
MLKKILIIDLGSVWGGQEIYSYNLMSSYKDKKYYIISISSQMKFKDIADEFYNISNHYFNFLNLKKLIEKLSQNVDIVHFNGNRALYLSLICKKTKPYIGTKHLPYFVGTEKNIKNIISQFLGKYLLKNIDSLICVAQATYNDLPIAIQKNAVVVYNGVDIGLNKYIHRISGNLKICYVARLTEHKGIVSVLNIIKQLFEKDNLIIELSIAGTGELQEYVEDFIKTNKHLSINYLGFLDSPRDIYAKSHLGILLSTYEGMPLNILEAFSAGLPFIAYDIPGVNEVIHNNYNGYLVEADNEKVVKEYIKKLAFNKEFVLEMSKNANYDYNNMYSLNIMVDNTLKVYKNKINENFN